MELDLDFNDNHVVSWEEHAAEPLHIVRLHQITEYDPVRCIVVHSCCPVLSVRTRCLLVRTRFCKFNLVYFDLDKQSRASRGPPILTLTSRDRIKLSDSINLISFKIFKSNMGYPINVFGTVLVRDQVDYKCIYLFRRDRDDPQVITSPVSVLVKEDLQLCVCAREGGCEAACFELTLDHLDDSRICFQGSYEIEVKVEWTSILNRTEKGVFRHVGHTKLLV
nr:uncharacterized protein LOC117849005 [Setaria viridis]